MLRAAMKQSFSDEAMKSNFQQMAPLLPEAAVAQGDSWKDDFTFKLAMIGGMKFGIASTLAELGGGKAKIKQDYTVQVKVEEKPDPENPLAGAGVEFKDSKGKAEMVFSIADGCLESQNVEMTMVVVIAAAGQEMPIKTKNMMKKVERKKRF